MRCLVTSSVEELQLLSREEGSRSPYLAQYIICMIDELGKSLSRALPGSQINIKLYAINTPNTKLSKELGSPTIWRSSRAQRST